MLKSDTLPAEAPGGGGGTWIIFIRVHADLVLKPNPV